MAVDSPSATVRRSSTKFGAMRSSDDEGKAASKTNRHAASSSSSSSLAKVAATTLCSALLCGAAFKASSAFSSAPHPGHAQLKALITDGKWRHAEIDHLYELGDSMQEAIGLDVTEGHTGTAYLLRKMQVALARMPAVKTICEIGFNSGHSASVWLAANPNAKVIMFDLWEHAYAPRAEAWLRSPAAAAHGIEDGDARLTLVKGSSLETVPQFAAENPDVKCDLISVDGGHTYDIALKDLENMHLLANPDFNVVTVDDTLCSLHWCEPVEEAVQEHQRRGTIRRVYGVSEGKVTREVEVEGDDGETRVEESTYYTRGMTVARYQF